MEVRNTPPKSLPSFRESPVLLEDLCVALRDVIVFNGQLPNGAAVVEKIDDVKAILAELSNRGVEVASTLQELSTKTDRLMGDLLEACLAYPTRTPFEKGLDGIQERLRCSLCGRAERPEETSLWMCHQCLDRTVEAIENRTAFPGLFLYRTYSESRGCPHSDSETVLATVFWSDEDWWDPGRCKQCYLDEKLRRADVERAK